MDGKTHTMMMVKAFFYAAHPSQFVAGDVKQREREVGERPNFPEFLS
jgi:hypothetical protein